VRGALPADLSAPLRRVARAFRRRKIPYVLVGGVATIVLGRPRATADLDLLVGGGRAGLVRAAAAATAAGFEDVAGFLRANPMLAGIARRLRCGVIHLDVMRSRDAHDVITLRHRRTNSDLGVRLPLPTAEDLLLLKLKAGRPLDLQDALGIAEAQRGTLDHDYLWRWAKRLGVIEEYNYVAKFLG
jgi:hypothetical protein